MPFAVRGSAAWRGGSVVLLACAALVGAPAGAASAWAAGEDLDPAASSAGAGAPDAAAGAPAPERDANPAEREPEAPAPEPEPDGSEAPEESEGAEPETDERTGVPAGPVALRLERRRLPGGQIPSHFVGLSIEWTLIERYMNPAARPAFARLLANLRTGILRIGGSSQDQVPFVADAQDSNAVVTPADLQAIRATLDAVTAAEGDTAVPAWGTILGTAMAPTRTRPHATPENAKAFAQAAAGAFPGREARRVVGIELGNEPDLTYGRDVQRYLTDLRRFADARVTDPFGLVGPNTSEPILPWQDIQARSEPTRYFWDWPAILDVLAPLSKERADLFDPVTTDHFYPGRRCTVDLERYGCATLERILAQDRMDNLAYEVHTHAREAGDRGLDYRLEETGTSSGRGAPGVSDVAASALWALDAMFTAACPQPPDAPGANADCATGAQGVNLHNAEVRAFSVPEEGNAYYNAIRYDPTPAMGEPTAAPGYYAMLLFSRFAQGARGLRPVAIESADPDVAALRAWRLEGRGATRRLFILNKQPRPVTFAVAAPGSGYAIDRLTPHDPTGAGRTLDAPEVRIDGRSILAGGQWPGFAPETAAIHGGRFELTVGAGEAVVVSVQGRAD